MFSTNFNLPLVHTFLHSSTILVSFLHTLRQFSFILTCKDEGTLKKMELPAIFVKAG